MMFCRHNSLFWFAVTVVISSCISQQEYPVRRCQAYDNSCRDCIRAPGCQWCSKFLDSNVRGDQHRCVSAKDDISAICQQGYSVNPENSIRITENRPLTDVNTGSVNGEDIVQLAPQRVSLRLRKGEPFNIPFKFRLATDYPIDLYYLMDLSFSMGDDKDNLAKLGSKLADTMQKLTTKFRLGFGSFVDKTVMPYTKVDLYGNELSCKDCARPYSFHNNLPLHTDSRKFAQEVRATPISGNQDSPEGGLDALLQAIVCRQEIGWREQAKRLLVFSTDAKFHHAGDGKLAGILNPNDGKCHVNSAGFYTEFAKLDYPSIAQINAAAQENQINIIFAVSGHQKLYEDLSDAVMHSSTGMLDRDSANVVALVRDQYYLISSEVQLSDNVASIPGSPLFVRYFTECLNKSSPIRQTRSCSGIKEGDEIEFVAQVEVLSVPSSEVRRDLQIQITTLQDTLTIDITVLAECECEQQGAEDREENSIECSESGVLQCGVCECYSGYYGANCQCSSNNAGNPNDSASDAAECLADPAEPEQCSGEGVCQCGTCICFNPPAVTGKYCECNEDDCNNGAGSLCSGRGVCNCGVCRCQAGWAGKHCQCPEDANCFIPGDSEPCSGKGECSCGQCSCEMIESVLYTGRYCEECSECASGKCEEFRGCVQCKVFSTGPLSNEECNNTCTLKPRELSSLEGQVAGGARLCTFPDESSGCDFNFTYKYQSNAQNYFIVTQVPQQCPPPLDVLGVVLGVIGVVVAIGVFTLILWRVLTKIHDMREFARFEDERKNVQWGTENSPIFKPPTGTYVNPAFQRQLSK